MLNISDIAIIGAGPYGLSIAAHLRASGIEHRIIGDPMQFWLGHMPKGMLLKSDGFASTLYDPGRDFPLWHYCKERNIEYADLGIPVRVEDFVPMASPSSNDLPRIWIIRKSLRSNAPAPDSRFYLSDGESFTAQRVVVATGHFEHVPSQLAPFLRICGRTAALMSISTASK